jgi:hypothetical protein
LRDSERAAAQPRQQGDDEFTDFLRAYCHAFMMNHTSGNLVFFHAPTRDVPRHF